MEPLPTQKICVMKYLVKPIFVLILLILVAKVCIYFLDTNHAKAVPDESLLGLIEGLDQVEMLHLTHDPDAKLPSLELGKQGTLNDGVYWHILAADPDYTAPIHACEVRTNAGKLKKILFWYGVSHLIAACDEADVYNDPDAGKTYADGYNLIYDEEGRDVDRENCGIDPQ